MKQRRNLIRLLFDRKRIEMNSRHHNRLAYCFLFFLLASTLSAGYIAFNSIHSNFTTFMLIAGFGLTSLLLAGYCYYRIRSVSIIGDIVILKSLQDKSEVTNIQSVRSVTSRKLLNKHLTFVHYRLDGTTRKVFAVTNAKNFRTSPENTFRKALQISEKEKERANHKPGSVLQPKSERLSFI